jgi:hypothetical protein
MKPEGMTFQEVCRHLLTKYPDAKFSRGRLVKYYLKEYWDVHIGITFPTLEKFLNTEWSSLERAFRDVLKDKKFKLPNKNDAKLQEKKAQFEDEYRKTLPKDEQEQFDFVFGGNELSGNDKK